MARESQVMRSTVERQNDQLGFGFRLEVSTALTAVVTPEQACRWRSRDLTWRETKNRVQVDCRLLIGGVGGLLGEDE